MDQLRSEFTRHDGRGTGVIDEKQFRTALERFGIREGLKPVIKKFSSGTDGVRYDNFLTHFQSRHGAVVAPKPQQQFSTPARARADTDPTQRVSFGSRTNVDRNNLSTADRNVTIGQQSIENHGTPAPQYKSQPGYRNYPQHQPAPSQHQESHRESHTENEHYQQQPPQHEERHQVHDRAPVEPPAPPAPPASIPSVTTPATSRIEVPTRRSSAFTGLDVHRGPAGVLDVHRSDSGSLAAFALGEIPEDKVDAYGTSHVGRRGRVAPATRAHDSCLPVASVACLNGQDFDQGSPLPTRSNSGQIKKGRLSRCNSPMRRFDMISGVKRSEGPNLDVDEKPEGRRHVTQREGSPRRLVGLRTYGDDGRLFREGHSHANTPRGMRHVQSSAGDTHFSVGKVAAPTSGDLQWPQGESTTPRITPSTVSNIPGLCVLQDPEPKYVQRKGRTKEPSSFGLTQLKREEMSPVNTRVRHLPTKQLRNHLASKINCNSATVTKAWVEMSKVVGGDPEEGPKRGMSPARFAEAVKSKYSIELSEGDVKRISNSDTVSFNDFNKICAAAPGSGVFLKKVPDHERYTGRKYLPHDSPSRKRAPPFAVVNELAESPFRGERQSRSMSLQHRPRDHRPVSAPTAADHFITTNMRAYSPARSLTPGRLGNAAGFPNRLRERSDSERRKRCFSPGFTNRESCGNPITHRYAIGV